MSVLTPMAIEELTRLSAGPPPVLMALSSGSVDYNTGLSVVEEYLPVVEEAS